MIALRSGITLVNEKCCCHSTECTQVPTCLHSKPTFQLVAKTDTDYFSLLLTQLNFCMTMQCAGGNVQHMRLAGISMLTQSTLALQKAAEQCIICMLT